MKMKILLQGAVVFAIALFATNPVDAANDAAAISAMTKAAEAGDADFQAELGHAYVMGDGVAKDPSQGLVWYRKAAAQGNARAQLAIGGAYWRGISVEKDLEQALAWYRKSADQGFAKAQVQLGYAYRTGEGVKADDTLARFWYEKAAAQGDDFAKTALAGMPVPDASTASNSAPAPPTAVDQETVKLLQETDYPQDYGWALAFSDMNKASFNAQLLQAEKGEASEQSALAFIYECGFVTKKNPDEAVKWYQKAAAQGYKHALFHLGLCLAAGMGVTQNPAEAANCFRKAAEKGDKPAADNYAICCSRGFGVPQNMKEYTKWRQRGAAVNGYNVADVPSPAEPVPEAATAPAMTPAGTELTLDDLVTLLEAGSTTDEILPELNKRGYAGATDAAALQALKKAGAKVDLLLAVKKAPSVSSPTAAMVATTPTEKAKHDFLIRLGIIGFKIKGAPETIIDKNTVNILIAVAYGTLAEGDYVEVISFNNGGKVKRRNCIITQLSAEDDLRTGNFNKHVTQFTEIENESYEDKKLLLTLKSADGLPLEADDFNHVLEDAYLYPFSSAAAPPHTLSPSKEFNGDIVWESNQKKVTTTLRGNLIPPETMTTTGDFLNYEIYDIGQDQGTMRLNPDSNTSSVNLVKGGSGKLSMKMDHPILLQKGQKMVVATPRSDGKDAVLIGRLTVTDFTPYTGP